jgi:hypothetical protein
MISLSQPFDVCVGQGVAPAQISTGHEVTAATRTGLTPHICSPGLRTPTSAPGLHKGNPNDDKTTTATTTTTTRPAGVGPTAAAELSRQKELVKKLQLDLGKAECVDSHASSAACRMLRVARFVLHFG